VNTVGGSMTNTVVADALGKESVDLAVALAG
jgi:hypothetical protein